MDPIRLLDMFRRRLWVFVLVLAATMLVVALATFSATRLYTATSQVLIDVRQKQVLGEDIQAVVAGITPEAISVETETEIMLSRSLTGRVVDSLNLMEDPEFMPRQGGLSGLISGLAGARPSGDESAAERAERREETINALQRRYSVTRRGTTYLINMSVTSIDAAKAAKIADAFANLYLIQQLETKYDTIAQANEWLSNRLDELRDEVQSKERAVEAYRAQSGLLTTDGVRLNEQTVAQLNLQLVEKREELAAREARYRSMEESLQEGGSGEVAAEALASPTITALRTQQAELERSKAELSTRYGPRHPAMQQVDREIEGLRTQIDSEVQRILDNLREEVRIARQSVNSIEASLATQRAGLVENNVGAVKLRELERDADASRTLYEAFLNRFRQVAEQSGIEQPDARIIARATAPTEPSFPNVQLNFVVGLLAGTLLGAAAVFLVEMLERTLRTGEDVQNKLGASCLGELPVLDRRTRMVDGELLSPEDFVLKRPLSPFGETLRAIRAGVFFMTPDRQVKVVAITSALPDEGKTTTAIGLARISALAGSRTVLVDCDLRRRSATHSLGLEVSQGLTEVLFRTASLNDVIQKDPHSDVDVVPLAQVEFTPRDLYGSDAMRSLMDTLRSQYDVVILDSAPTMPVSDTRLLAALADATVFVARWGKTPVSVIRNALEQLRGHGARIAGIVLQRVETTMMSRLLYDRPDYYSELYQTYYIR
jgi:exopolysaccharide transport family protein